MSVILYGLTVAIIGLAVVFIGLVILIVCITLLSVMIRRISGNKNKAKAAPAPAPAPAPVAAPSEPVEEDVTDDAELIAVIAAALAAFTDSDKPLVVRRVRRVSGWNRASRAEQVYRF